MSQVRATTRHRVPRRPPLLIGPNADPWPLGQPGGCVICYGRITQRPRISLYEQSPKRRVRYLVGDVCESCWGQESPLTKRVRFLARFFHEHADWLQELARRPIQRLPNGEQIPALAAFPAAQEGRP